MARPARHGTSDHHQPHLHRLFRQRNEGRRYDEQIKPFNFLLIAFVPPIERPANDQDMVLDAPYTGDPRTWGKLPWTNRHSGQPYAITKEPSDGLEREGMVTVKSDRQVLAEYATHPEVAHGP
jgi:hypothetical protein